MSDFTENSPNSENMGRWRLRKNVSILTIFSNFLDKFHPKLVGTPWENSKNSSTVKG